MNNVDVSDKLIIGENLILIFCGLFDSVESVLYILIYVFIKDIFYVFSCRSLFLHIIVAV